MTKKKVSVKTLNTIDDLTPQRENANAGTEEGRILLRKSLEKLKAGRGVLVDANGEGIAGSKTIEIARELGLPIRVVQTTGDELVVTQRIDLDLARGDLEAIELGIADNVVAQKDLAWDKSVLFKAGQLGVAVDDWMDYRAISAAMNEQDPDTPPVFETFDEDVALDVIMIECPSCGHKFPA
jgi:hypothetical protein